MIDISDPLVLGGVPDGCDTLSRRGVARNPWVAFTSRGNPERQRPPDPAVRPAALNAGFAPHCRRSDARGSTGQIDPYEPFLAMSADGRVGPGAAVGAGFLDQL